VVSYNHQYYGYNYGDSERSYFYNSPVGSDNGRIERKTSCNKPDDVEKEDEQNKIEHGGKPKTSVKGEKIGNRDWENFSGKATKNVGQRKEEKCNYINNEQWFRGKIIKCLPAADENIII